MADPASPAAAPAKTITTAAAKPATAEVGTEASVVQKAPGETADDMVRVRALHPYQGNEDKRSVGLPGHADNDPFPVTRARAAELRALGHVEYVDKADHDREADDAAKKAGDTVRKKYEVKR